MTEKLAGVLLFASYVGTFVAIAATVKTATAGPSTSTATAQQQQSEAGVAPAEPGPGSTDMEDADNHNPFGLTEAKLCSVPTWAFVGTVIDRQSYWDPDPGNPIATDAIVEVTSVIHGSPPAQVELTVYGGVVDGQRQATGGHPRFEPRSRYVLFILDTREMPNIGWDHVIYTWFRLPDEGAIPDSALLEQVWHEHCAEGSSTLDAFGLSTFYMDYVPERFRRLCRHYNSSTAQP